MWNSIVNAPEQVDLEIAVLDEEGMHPLVFPCRRRRESWFDARTGREVSVHPSHWREWRRAITR